MRKSGLWSEAARVQIPAPQRTSEEIWGTVLKSLSLNFPIYEIEMARLSISLLKGSKQRHENKPSIILTQYKLAIFFIIIMIREQVLPSPVASCHMNGHAFA